MDIKVHMYIKERVKVMENAATFKPNYENITAQKLSKL